MHTRSASACTLWFWPKFPLIQANNSRRRVQASAWASSVGLNWLWVSPRTMNSARLRAICTATGRPRSASISAKARSSPVVTPAEVQMGPSRT